MDKVKTELQRMEKMGMISLVSEPTDWCAGLVVVPKPDRRVRICVDLTKLNQNVQWERHIIPSVKQEQQLFLSKMQTPTFGRSC